MKTLTELLNATYYSGYSGTPGASGDTGASGFSGFSGQSSTNPYDVVTSIEGKPTANSYILTFITVRSFTIPIGFNGSLGICANPATSESIFTITKNGLSVGTITFSAAATSATFSGSAGSFAIGDVLRIVSPVIQDSTLADIGITLKGTA